MNSRSSEKHRPEGNKKKTLTKRFLAKLLFLRKKPKSLFSQPETDSDTDKNVNELSQNETVSDSSSWYDSEQADQPRDRPKFKTEQKEEPHWYIEESEFKLMSAAAQLEDSLNECKQELIQVKQRAAKLQIEDVNCVQLGDAFLVKSPAAEPQLEMWLAERLKADRATEKKLQGVLETGKLNLQRLNQLMAERIHSKTH